MPSQLDTFQTLADPTRRRIVEALRHGEQQVNDLVARAGIHQSGVSRHLRILHDAGFVSMRPEGQRRLYSLKPEPFRAIEACLNGKLQYDMIAETPEMVTVMKELGLPASHVERARFSEFRPLERLVLAIMMDFLPGVAPYEGTLTVDFFPSGEWVRMV